MQQNEAKEKWNSSVQKIQMARSFASMPALNSGGTTRNFSHSSLFVCDPSPLNNSFSSRDHSQADNLNGLSWQRMLISRAKLKASSTTSEILAAFSLITMVELQINDPTEVPEWLFILFAVNTTTVVSLNVLAIMISTYILPGIEAAATVGHHNSELFAGSPHDRMKKSIEIAWVLSNILGLLLFFVQLAVLMWVKYWDFSFNAALSAMVVLCPFIFIFIGSGLYFYHVLAVIKSKKCLMEVDELENIRHGLDSIV